MYFIFVRPSFLPEDLRAATTTLDAVSAVAPGLGAWLQLVFAVLGGQMAALGVVLINAAIRVRRGQWPQGIKMLALFAISRADEWGQLCARLGFPMALSCSANCHVQRYSCFE